MATLAGLAPVSDPSAIDPAVRSALGGPDQPPLSPVTAAFERGPLPAFERVTSETAEVQGAIAGMHRARERKLTLSPCRSPPPS